MPYADSPTTAHHWAVDRSIALWALFSGDLSPAEFASLSVAFEQVRRDGARLALLVPSGVDPSAAERAAADLIVHGPAAPSPFALFQALTEAGVEDVRSLGILGSDPRCLAAGH